jgi:outer membrane protein TolC
MMTSRCVFLTATLAVVTASIALAQPPPAAERSLTLAALHEAAMRADPRSASLELEAARTALRVQSLDMERRPALRTDWLGQYQSDVPTPPPIVPGGQPLWLPPHQTYEVALRVDQPLLDPTIGARQTVEQAALDEAQARVRTALFPLRQDVNEAFFAALLLQERLTTLRETMSRLEALRDEALVRVEARTALPSEAASIEAVLLERGRDETAMAAERRAALIRLGQLTGRPLSEADSLAVPDLQDAARQARERRGTLRARPEYAQFDRTRERIDSQRAAVSAGERPRLSAFGRVGYGKPGPNFIEDQFDAYWSAGLQMQWNPWRWGTPDRERESLALQQQILGADEAAFRDGLERAVVADLADLEWLETTGATDDRIVALREAVDRETRLRYDERVATIAQYLDQNTDLLDAQLIRATHQVELGRVRAQLLTRLGLEVR